MRGVLAKLCKKNGIAKRVVSISLALLMVLSTLQALPAGILVANAAETTYAVTDILSVKIGENSYAMNTYKNGVFEAIVNLPAGTHTGTLVHNGAATGKEATVTLDSDGAVYFRLNGDTFSTNAVETAAIAGSIDKLTSTNAEKPYVNWKPSSDAAEMTYLGGGLWLGTMNFEEVTAEGGQAIEYKVAFNDDDSWNDKNYGLNGENIPVTIPKGATSFTVFLDEISGTVFDDVRTADFEVVQNSGTPLSKNPYTTAISLIGTARESGEDWVPTATGYDFTPISNTLYRYEKTFASTGTYTYKVVFDHVDVWYEKESGNQSITTTEANTHVVFLYDTSSGYIYDTVNDASTIDALLTGSSLPTYDATVYFYNAKNWSEIGVYSWYGTPQVLPNGAWPGTNITEKTVDEKKGWYYVEYNDMPTSSFNIIFNDNKKDGAAQTKTLPITLSDNIDKVWVIGSDDDIEVVYTEPDIWTNPPTGFTGEVTLHFKDESDWEAVNAWVWSSAGNYYDSWPGGACTANAENTGWFDVLLDLNLSDSFLEFKFNKGSNNDVQTGNLSATLASGTTDLWITGGASASNSTVLTTAPDGWVAGSTGKNLTINYYNSNDYDEVAAYVHDGTNPVGKSWPGTQATKELADDATDKWYTVTISDIGIEEVKLIMNNNKSSNGSQDEELPLTLSKTNTEIWIKDGKILQSPVVNGTSVTFTYVDESREATSLKLTGSNWGWGDEGPEFTKEGDSNVYTLVLSLPPSEYTYKFNPGGGNSNWFHDPLNTNTAGDGYGGTNSVLVVPGMYTSPLEAKKGENFALPTSLNYINASGESSTKPVTYALKNDANSSYVTMVDGTTMNAKAGCTETAVDLIATATDGSNETATITVALVDQIYKYTVYAYSPITDRMNVNNAALWIWDNAKETTLEDAEYAFTTTETLTDGRAWLKAEIQLSCAQSIGFIMKSKGGAKVWNWQTADLVFANKDKTDQTIYLVDGFDKVYTSLDEVPEISQLCIEYTRSDNSYTNPYVEVWNNGYSYKENDSTKNFTYNFDNSTGKYIVNIPVALGAKDKTVGFNIYNKGAIDGTSNTVTIPAGEKLTKVKYNNGVITIVPDSAGYVADRANNKISFYYRDEVLFAQNKMHTIDSNSVYLAIRTAVGDAAPSTENRIKMTYDSNDERFELEDQTLATNSDVYYYYVVGSNSVLDAKNDRTATLDGVEYCMVRNRVYSINLSASVKYSDMTYDDGNVLYVSFDDVEGFNPEKITVDLSSLGLGSKVEMDKELKALSFGCLEGTSVGTKAIKVTLTDDCDVSYTANAIVNVKARTKTANTSSKLGTFDWDEAVIYFAITDRFFDGNSSNNTGDPNSTADDAAYNPEDAGSYHGGDFAGLTQKINYLYDLGVNTIWLTPIVDNVDINCDNGEKDDCDYYAYHGYWASDFTKLNPHLGTDAELKALINAAHAKGMKIMVDVVINHGGYGEEDTFNNIIPGMVRDVGNMEAGDIKASLSGLPDFMTEDPEVRQQLIDWQTYWMTEYDIDYYRVDTVKHVENTTWNAFKNALVEKNQDFKLIGEYFDAGYLNDFEQLDTGRMDSVLDFNFNDLMARLVDEDLAGIESELGRRNTMLTNTATVGSFTSSHDEDGLLYTMTQRENDATWAEALMKVAATYQATAKGQPVIYYGEEIGLTGQNNWPYYTNRPDFDWTEQATQAADTNSMFNHYKKVLNIRRNYSEVFAKGTRTAVVTDSGEGYEVFSRSYKDKTLYVGVNVWGDARETTFYVAGAAGSVYTDLYSGKTYTVKADGSLTISIPGAQDGGTAILVGTGVTVTDTNEITVKVHYTRNDGDYEGWNLWAWTDDADGAYDFVKEGNDMVATVSKIPGRSTTRLGYKTRLNEWAAKDYEEDQYIDLSDIVSGTVHYYINASSYGGTRVLGGDAIVGSKIVGTSYNRNTNVVTVNMSTPISGSALDAFTIMCASTDSKIDIESVEKNGNQYFLTLKQDISSMEALLLSYTITYDGYTYNLMTPNMYSSEEFEDAYTYTGTDLGLKYTASASTFKLWAPTADSVTVNIYSGGTAGTADKLGSYPMTGGTKAEKGVWTCVLNGDWSGKYYTYTVNVANEVNEACDPYARTTGVNGKRAMILDLSKTNPDGWTDDKNAKRNDGMKYTDAVIYELHVRDLSIDPSSGVDSKYQGKFLGLTQTGTKTAGGNPTALDHMIDLGITHLHLIPVYDYGSVDETKLDTPQFNWGYDPVNYNVPEGSYSTNPYDGSVRVAEMKQMVKTLHDNNINVVMDVVYNHVYDAGSFSFNQIVPKYFSRTWADGSYTNGSGCGNDTASERSMVRKYIVDSILYWHNEYHIDGFRFDLVGLIDTVTIQQIVDEVHRIDPDILFYGEGWTMVQGEEPGTIMATQANSTKTDDFAFFNDVIRNGLAGNNEANGYGFVFGNLKTENAEEMEAAYLGRSKWCTTPSDTINYASCHDNYTLMDKINIAYARDFGGQAVTSYSQTPGTEQVKLNNLAASYYMFSLGIPLVHAGEDMLRMKFDESGEIIHNSYNSSDYVNKIRWSNLDTTIYADTVDYYEGLVAFRKNHESLRLATPEDVTSYVSSYRISNNIFMYSFDPIAGEVSDGIITIYNASTADKEINIYDSKYSTLGIVTGDWYVCVNADDAGTELLAKVGADGKVTVKARSATALVKIKSAETANYKVGDDLVDTDSVYTRNNVVTLKFADDQKDGITTGVDGVVALNVTTSTPATLTWVSDNEAVATVDAQGRVTAKAVGTANITVSTLHGVEATCTVTVTNDTVTPSVTMDKTELNLVAGESDTLVITVSPSSETAIYASSDETVATIDSTGKVTALKAGTATVTATLADGTSVSCTVTVEAAPVEEKVTLNATKLSLTPGGSATIVATVTPAGTTVNFSSNDTDVATVDANGKVTAVGEGTAEIIVATAAGKTAICTVTVAKAVAPTPNPVPSKPGSDATTGVGDGAQAGINPGTPTKPADEITSEDEEQVKVEVETKAETEVPENVTDVTPVVDEKLQDAIANETEKILEDILDDEISDDVMSEETIENVKKAQENGDGIITEVIVDKLDEADVDADVKEALAKALADSVKDKKGAETKIAQYLDLSVLLKTTNGEKLGTINKLSKDMTFTIAVPEDLVKEGRVFVVLRMHEGETTVLETSLNSDGTLSFKTDRFSTYALAYIDAPAEDAKDDEVTEGDIPSGSTTTEEDGNNFATFIIVGLIIVIIAALVIIFLAMKRKKD